MTTIKGESITKGNNETFGFLKHLLSGFAQLSFRIQKVCDIW